MAEEINNKEFFEEVIQNHYNDTTIKIIDFELKSGIGKGENYGSQIFRAQINWKRNNLGTGEEKLVIKTMPESEIAKAKIIEGRIFEVENLYYSEILPMYKNIMTSKGIENYSRLAPTYLKCNNPNVVIMEDLAPLGFRMGDRRNGGDFNHGLLLMKALARNQALSIAVNRKKPGYFQNISSKSFFDNLEDINEFYTNTMKEQIDALEQWPEFQDFVGRIQPKSAEEIIDIFRVGKLKSISQGDCWMNNMLFRYDETTKTPVEVCILDFQMYLWGSMVFDVTYFMYSSLSPDVLEDKKDVLINEYIDEFHKWMNDLNEDLGEYTRENILKDFKNMQYFGVIQVLTLLYILSCDPKDALSFENMIDEEGKRQREKARNNPIYKKKLLKHLQIFARDNVI